MPELTDADRAAIKQARELLETGHGYDAASMADRIGALEWQLGEVLRRLDRHGGS